MFEHDFPVVLLPSSARRTQSCVAQYRCSVLVALVLSASETRQMVRRNNELASNFSRNREKLPRKLMLRLRKCTGMSVYRVRECLSCLKRLKGAAKRPETIHALGETLIVKNIREVREFIRGYRCSSIRAVAELSRIVMELYSREPFKIHQVCAIITSKLLAHGRK